jgi:type I restriction enzyme M protein
MLDQTTKRKLDSARQILVGKVPDPKAQVEQITTALIYKFMDDMDKENEEVGLKTQFFVDDWKKFSWTKILDNKLSGQERLDLYVQAITNMPKNPRIPQLFRNIFKGAFLPYNDARTLSLFLKEINEFNYEHSENLGNAFEYLLSILGSQGDAGQFRTPRHIIDFIIEVVDPKKNETILDPACGTAGFLISAYKHILKQNKEKALTPDEKLKLMNNLAGYDISPDMVKLALVNMYLHGFPEPKIHEYDSLTSEKRWDETFDVILANPPFMTPKGGISPHKRFTIQCKKAEALFVDYIIEHLNINGKAGVVVPDGIVANPSNLYAKLRELAIENGLYAVVSLHNTVFKPYAGAKTSVLFFDKAFAKKSKDIIFIKINNDGYEKGEQRRKIEQNDIPEVIKLIADFKSGNKTLNSEIDFIIVPREQLNKKFSLFVNKCLIANRENGNESVEISTLFDIQKGTLQSTKKTEGEFDFITAAQEWSTHNSHTHDCEALIFAFGAAGSLGRTHYVNGKFIASDLCFILTPKKDSKYPVNLSFYHAYFNAIREQIVADLAKGVSKLAINKTEFSNYLIDYVAIEKQNDFGNKIVAEQKKIAEMKAKIEESEENIKETIFEIL